MMYNKKNSKGGIQMKKKLANFIRVLLVFLVLAGVAMCRLWLPGAIYLIQDHVEEYIGAWGLNTAVVLYAVSIAVALPVFAIFVMAFAFPCAIENDTLFSLQTGKLLKRIGILLVADCAVFCALLTALTFMVGWLLTGAFLFVGVLGIAVGCMLLVLSQYVEHAAALKEEVDCTL